MRRFANFIVSHPRFVIVLSLLASAFFASQLRHLETQISLKDLTPRNHKYMKIDDRFSALFGAEQTSVIALRVKTGDIFTPDTLARLARLTRAVEAIPGVVPSSVFSIASPNVKAIENTANGLEIGPVMEEVPTDASGLRALRARVSSDPQFIGTLVTRDDRGALILADFASDASVRKITATLEAVAERERSPAVEIFIGGQTPALAALDEATQRIAPLLAFALIVIAGVHYEAFRTGQAAALPLVTAGLSVVWSVGLMTLLGYRITPWTAVTTILVLTVAAGHSVQILKRYYECFDDLGDNRAAVVASLERIGPVMLTAGFVASSGFLSLASFGVPAVREFGLMAAIGIGSALALELSFIPAWRVLLRAPKVRERSRERSHGLLDRALTATIRAVFARPKWVVLALTIVVGVAATGIPLLQVNTSFRSWFLADAPVILADREIREGFTGTSTIRVLISGDSADAMLDPQVMSGIAALQRALDREENVTGTLSIAGFLASMNRGFHDGNVSEHRVPNSKELIAQYVLLYGSGDLERVLTSDGRAAAVYALSRSDDVAWVERVFQRLHIVGAREFPPTARVHVAGGELAQAVAMNSTVVSEKLQNMLQVALAIFFLSSCVFRSVIAGVLVLAPLVCAAIVNLGLMGWLGTSLSFATATYTAMGVSLGADFAIYLLFRIREESRSAGKFDDSVRVALLSSGRAIFFVASAIAAGYVVLTSSTFVPWRQLGIYMSLMMASSAAATLTLIPALVLTLRPRFLFGTSFGGGSGR